MRSDILDYLFTLAMASVLIAWIGYSIPLNGTTQIHPAGTAAYNFDFRHTAASQAIFVSVFIFVITIYAYARRRMVSIKNEISTNSET